MILLNTGTHHIRLRRIVNRNDYTVIKQQFFRLMHEFVPPCFIIGLLSLFNECIIFRIVILRIVVLSRKDFQKGHRIIVVGNPRSPSNLVVAVGSGLHKDFRFLVTQVYRNPQVPLPHILQAFSNSLMQLIRIIEDCNFR